MSLNTKFERYRIREKQRNVENEQPEAYRSQYQSKIDNTLDTLGDTPTVDSTVSEAYRQYRQRATENAMAAAENAMAGTSALSGGYGTDYAASAARQGYEQGTENLGLAQTGLRTKALSEYQNQQNGLVEMLNALQKQDSIERGEAAGDLADWQNWRNYWQNRAQAAQQADRTETQLDKVDTEYDKSQKENFWNNVWNTAVGVGSALKNGYDSYMGYTQQQENARMNALLQAVSLKKNGYDGVADSILKSYGMDSGMLDNTSLPLDQQLTLYGTAFDYYQKGAPEAGKKILDDAGLDSSLFDNYTGTPVTRDTQANVLLQAANLTAGGNPEAGDYLLKLYGMEPGAAGDYSTISGRTFAEAMAKSTASSKSGGTGRSSSGSSGSSSSGSAKKSGFTNAQLQQMAKDYKKMKETDTLYDFYEQTLTEAGWLNGNKNESTAIDQRLWGTPLYQDVAKKWGIGTETSATQASTQGVPYNTALQYAKGWKEQGADEDTIYARLLNMGATDETTAKVWNAMGW